MPRRRSWAAWNGPSADLYRLADALLFPSAKEGLWIPVLEAGLVVNKMD